MSVITFDNFSAGLDLRKGASVSDANRLRVLDNCYVTTGKTIRKRPGMVKIADLEPGTKGLRAANGKLNTFYATGTISHADTQFKANKIAHPTLPAMEVQKIHYADSFNGFLYVSAQYNNGNIRHHYLDDVSTLTAWAASTALTLGAVRRPVTSNGYRYEVTTAGTTAATEPTWPTTIGATVTNGSVVFTCRGTEITDANCPNTAAVVKKASKIFSVKDDVVRFCKTNDPRNWTEASNAGFLGVGVQQSGAINPTALGEYAGNLVVFFSDSAQVWVVDPDPANMKFVQGVDVGCPFPYGAANMAGDVFFASYDGVRSITTQSTTGNLIDVDVGSPIDSVLKPVLTPSASVRSFYFRGGGQFWSMIGSAAYVYSFSRTSKISAWSRYVFPFPITDVTEMNGDLFFRSGDTVYRFDEAQNDDAGVVFDVTIEFAYLDFQAPGVLKMITGMDSVMVGEAEIAHRFDARNASLITPGVTLSGDTRPGELTPVEVCTVGIAPVLTCRNSLPFELHALTYLFESLGSLS
jgi:hypothetical protein